MEPQDREALLEEITQALLAVKCPYTGKSIVSKVHRREDTYSGRYTEFALDLFIEWNEYSYIQRPSFLAQGNGFIEVLEGKELARAERMSRPSGIHRPEGILIGCGEGIKQGNRIKPPSLMDLNPTILYSLGVPISEEIEGIVIQELFEPGFLAENPIQIGKADRKSSTTSQKESYTDQESEIIRERLSGLGYID